LPGQELQRLLNLWREAELRWEATPADDPAIVDARRDVLSTWHAYNRAAGTLQSDEVVLVADDSMTYVEAFGPTDATLGWTNAGLVGKKIADVTPLDELDAMDESWRTFVMAGRLEGTYRLRTADGQVRHARFVARSHYPVAGLHVSRIRLIDPAVE
jgi:PAS domain-containing protein